MLHIQDLEMMLNYLFLALHTSNEKKSPKIGNPFWHEKQCIFTNQPSYFWLFLAIFAYLRICSKSPRIYFAFRAEYPSLFLPIFLHLTCGGNNCRSEYRACAPKGHYSWIVTSILAATVLSLCDNLRVNCHWSKLGIEK